MALNISIVQSERAGTDYSDIVEDLCDTFEALRDLPNTRYATVEFPDAKSARAFARKAGAWAEDSGLAFYRKGPVKDNPETVTFRVYTPREASK